MPDIGRSPAAIVHVASSANAARTACSPPLCNASKYRRTPVLASVDWLTLSYMNDVVSLDVRDDGVGFDPDACPSRSGGGGFGLTAMRQRVEGLSGSLAVESEPGSGTTIAAGIPVIPAGRVAVEPSPPELRLRHTHDDRHDPPDDRQTIPSSATA
jgi:hypothetical protein